MVIRIVKTIASIKMTIAVTLKNVLARAENSGEKGAKYPFFVKGCYFYDPRNAQKCLQQPPKASWMAEKIRDLRPEKRPLRLYIYTLSPLVLHNYTVGCKGFSLLSV